MGNIAGSFTWDVYNVFSSRWHTANIEIAHFWSLCVEEQFYLLWPLAVWFIRDRKKLIWTAASLSALALALRVFTFAYFHEAGTYAVIFRNLPWRMDTLLIGSLLALVLRGPAADRWQRAGRWVFLAGTAGMVAIFILSPGDKSPWTATLGLTLIALASAGLICSTLRSGSIAYRLFHTGPIRFVGKYSYGFYIYHLLFRPAWVQVFIFLVALTHSLALSGIIFIGLVYMVTLVVSKLSYDLIEVRFLRYKRYFEYDSELTEHKHAFSLSK
ncbi:MAG: acyltransferase [Acidobacteriaceae bacterium]|jgi:peptidoglycan/LPS O-acetylase OafA/YrhL|nr:acyltransferase [Acidobacteriaceae bacterium]